MKKLFQWTDIFASSSEDVCEDTSGSTIKGKSLNVIDYVTRCVKKLIGSDCDLPAIPVDDGDSVQLMSGSVRKPIKLPLMQKQESGSFTSILFQRPDGTFVRWEPPKDDTCDYKLKVFNGSISIVKDRTKNNFHSSEFSEEDVNDVGITHLVGARTTTDCDGEAMIELVLLDKSQVCGYCDSIYGDPLA